MHIDLIVVKYDVTSCCRNGSFRFHGDTFQKEFMYLQSSDFLCALWSL